MVPKITELDFGCHTGNGAFLSVGKALSLIPNHEAFQHSVKAEVVQFSYLQAKEMQNPQALCNTTEFEDATKIRGRKGPANRDARYSNFNLPCPQTVRERPYPICPARDPACTPAKTHHPRFVLYSPFRAGQANGRREEQADTKNQGGEMKSGGVEGQRGGRDGAEYRDILPRKEQAAPTSCQDTLTLVAIR
ncbi:hypothetical protein EV356DRAFT_512743 [Viridothelium virens]|uniref:Uncharacterized protein n=1 Tax=Viridothelium virens TaxID=1048519 RepID=A0A6A6HFA7_VIRVR|nr:hypothetical protein EV356DRAFT_512743 [Viridothelium virens]